MAILWVPTLGFMAFKHYQKHYPNAQSCFRQCVLAEHSNYMSKIYGTADQFMGQIKELCEIKLENRVCVINGMGSLSYEVAE